LPSKKGVSIIKCECGFEIPVVADVKMLGSAIDEHVEEHRRNCQDPENVEIVVNRIQDNLFKQLFEKIVQMSY
jgi:hypothetical protein